METITLKNTNTDAIAFLKQTFVVISFNEDGSRGLMHTSSGMHVVSALTTNPNVKKILVPEKIWVDWFNENYPDYARENSQKDPEFFNKVKDLHHRINVTGYYSIK